MINMADIQLVSAPLDRRFPMYEEGEFAPMGLLWLASFLKNKGFDVEIIDGQYRDLDYIKSHLNAKVIGVNFTIRSSHSLDQIVEAANNIGSTVVVGGQAATQLAKQLLGNSNIDGVVRYDGEEAMELIAKGADNKMIPNLTYREGRTIKENPVKLMDLRKLPKIDWGTKGIDLEFYWSRFQDAMKNNPWSRPYKKPISAFTKKGCPMRQKGNGCSFCSRIDTELRSKTPRQVYDEFKYLVLLGADRIEEFSDSWLYDKKWLRELIGIIDKEGHWGVPVRIYGDVRHIQDEETVEIMKRIGVDSVILGIESGNEDILMRNGKNTKRQQVLRTASLLGNAGIMASPSYVLGLIGETKQTLQDTFEIADEIKRRCKVEVGTFCIMTPFPGSKAWKLLLKDPSMHAKYSSAYHFDMGELQKDFITRFTDLGGKCYCLGYISGKLNEYLATRKEAVALLK